MYTKKEVGKIGEDISSKYLKNSNYVIAKDIKRNEVVFIEVKTRTNKKYGEPSEAIDQIKLKHIYKTAQYYIKQNKLEKAYIRFDAIEVYLSPNLVKANVNHILNIM